MKSCSESSRKSLSKTQIIQAINFARERYLKLLVRPVGLQEMKDGSIVLLEFTPADHPDGIKIQGGGLRRYKLVPMSEVPFDKQQSGS